MDSGQNTTTPLGAAVGSHIYFSRELPEFKVEHTPAGEQTPLAEPQRIGEMALSLQQRDATIEQLMARVTALETTLAYLEASTDVALPPVDGAPRASLVDASENDEPGNIGREEVNGDFEPDLTPDETLLPIHQKQERIVLYLLHCPDLTLKHKDAGGFLRRELGYESGQNWNNAKTTLSQLGVISVVKVSPTAKRSIEIALNMETLLKSIGKPWLTQRVLETIRRSGASQQAEPAEESDTAVRPALNNGSDEGGQVNQMSARTRKAVDRQPDPVPGYRSDGKRPRHHQGRPFLVHRPKVGGAQSTR